MNSNEDHDISAHEDDMPRLMNDNSQDDDDERHEGQNAQIYVDNQQVSHLIRALELQRTIPLAPSIQGLQSGYGSLDQHFCVHPPRTNGIEVHDQPPSST